MNIKSWINVPVHKSAVLIVFLFFITWAFPRASSALIGLSEGDKPQEIVLDDLQGKTVRVSEYYGKEPVIIVFWEQPLSKEFLDYSMDELHFLSDYYDRFHKKAGLEIFGIYTPEGDGEIPEDEITRVRNIIKINKISFPVLIDRGFKFFQEFGVIALPSTIMVDKTGKVGFIYPSFPLAARPLMDEQVKILVGMAAPAAAREAVKGPDSKSDRLYRYALLMFKKGLFEQALSPLKKSLELDPGLVRSHNLMGVVLWKRGKSDEAREAFAKSIELEKDNIAANLNYSVLLFEQERYEEVEKRLKALPVNDDASGIKVRYLLGLVYRNTNRIDKAIQKLEEAGNLIEEMEREDRSAGSFSSSYRIFLLHELSALYQKKDDKDKAIELLKCAVSVALDSGGNPDAMPLHERKDIMLYE